MRRAARQQVCGEGHADFRGHLQLIELAEVIDWTAPSGGVVDEPFL
jgi:hypothetical protein